MAGFTTPWYWNTPDGGGWVRYWNGEFHGARELADSLDRGWRWGARGEQVPLTADDRAGYAEALADRPRHEPTAAERRAWRRIDPPAEGDTSAAEGLGRYESGGDE